MAIYRAQPGGRQRHFLMAALGCWMAMGVLALISLLFFPGQSNFLLTICAITGLTCAVVAGLIGLGRIRSASLVFCIAVDLSFFYLALNIHGQEIQTTDTLMTRVSCLALMGLAVLFSGALLGRWAGFVFAACNTVMLVIVLQWVDPLFGPQVSIPFFWWVLALAVALYESLVDSTLAKLSDAHAGLEVAVATRTHDLQLTIKELEVAKRELHVANSELQAFAGAASHDLRSPLTGIMGFAELLQASLGQQIAEKDQQRLEQIISAAQRMAEIIEDFLRLSRAGRGDCVPSVVRVDVLAHEVASALVAQEPQRRVEWTIATPIEVSADPGLVRIALDNVLRNAWKYSATRDVAKIAVTPVTRDGRAGFKVTDNGVGFSMAAAGQLFQPFVRLHDQVEFMGTGVGLATVRRIARRHGGEAYAEAEVGKGATFTIVFSDSAMNSAATASTFSDAVPSS